MLRVVGVASTERLHLEVARTFGTRCAVGVCACLALYFAWLLWLDRSLYHLTLTALMALCAWLVHGESEEAVLDRSKNLIWLEKRVPFRRLMVMRLGPLSELQSARIETEPTNKLQRLVLGFESGHRFPLSDAYLDTRAGVACEEGAGLKDAKDLIERLFLRA